MPHVELKPSYQVTMTNDELRLVTMALAGMLRDDTDKARALQLNVHLCHLRATMLRDAKEVAERALDGAEKIMKGTQ